MSDAYEGAYVSTYTHGSDGSDSLRAGFETMHIRQCGDRASPQTARCGTMPCPPQPGFQAVPIRCSCGSTRPLQTGRIVRCSIFSHEETIPATRDVAMRSTSEATRRTRRRGDWPSLQAIAQRRFPAIGRSHSGTVESTGFCPRRHGHWGRDESVPERQTGELQRRIYGRGVAGTT